MATKRAARTIKANIPPALRDYFLTGSYDNYSLDEEAEVFYMCCDEKKLKDIWDTVKDDLTKEFVKENPGRLPAACGWTWED